MDVKRIRSIDNLAKLFTKSLPTARHTHIAKGIGMQRFSSYLICEQSCPDPSTLF